MLGPLSGISSAGEASTDVSLWAAIALMIAPVATRLLSDDASAAAVADTAAVLEEHGGCNPALRALPRRSPSPRASSWTQPLSGMSMLWVTRRIDVGRPCLRRIEANHCHLSGSCPTPTDPGARQPRGDADGVSGHQISVSDVVGALVMEVDRIVRLELGATQE